MRLGKRHVRRQIYKETSSTAHNVLTIYKLLFYVKCIFILY